jgi:hypothetical protein
VELVRVGEGGEVEGIEGAAGGDRPDARQEAEDAKPGELVARVVHDP